MHWCATMKNKATGHEFVVEGLELDVFRWSGGSNDCGCQLNIQLG